MDVTGEPVCKKRERAGEAAARRYRCVTSFSGQRLCPGVCAPGNAAPYVYQHTCYKMIRLIKSMHTLSISSLVSR